MWDGDSWELMTIDGAANNVDNTTVELDGSNNLKVKAFNPDLVIDSVGAIKMTGTSGSILNSPYSVSFGASISNSQQFFKIEYLCLYVSSFLVNPLIHTDILIDSSIIFI